MSTEDVHAHVAEFWDADAATYDQSPGHSAASPAERAAWTAALARHLPDPPAAVLDVGAGTGFLSLAMARLGHRVTALDLSSGMLGRLRASAGREGLDVAVVEGRADEPPEGPFGAVVERHLLWTLPDPGAALAAWRRVCPDGRLVVFEGLWGAADPVEALRARARKGLRRLRGTPPDHHGHYDPGVLSELPLSRGTTPDLVVEAVERAGWGPARLEQLPDVAWARLLHQSPLERALRVTPQFLVRAG
ncbi:MAG: class I SAM-dependent methyltransferase [Acidimicrobiales bacterium]